MSCLTSGRLRERQYINVFWILGCAFGAHRRTKKVTPSTRTGSGAIFSRSSRLSSKLPHCSRPVTPAHCIVEDGPGMARPRGRQPLQLTLW